MTRVRLSTAYLFGIACVLFPVSARNASLGGEWSPTTFQAGSNFYIGNNQFANGLYVPLVPGHETPLHERSDAIKIAEATTGHDLSARQVSRFWFAKAWQDISNAPIDWFQLLAVKALMVVNDFEVPDVESMVVYRDYSVVLLMFDHFWTFGAIAVLAVMGIAMTASQRHGLWLWNAMILIMIIAIVAFFVLGRYRFPLAILLMPYAAAGVTQFARHVRDQDFRKLVVPGLLAIGTAIICYLPIHDTRTLNASSFANSGAAAAEGGALGEATTLFRRAIAEAPEMPEAHVNLGRAMMLRGQIDDAIRHFRIALRLQPNLADVDFFLATALERSGQIELARQHYARAKAFNPTDRRVSEALLRIDAKLP